MAYYAQQEGGNYGVYDATSGVRVSTTSSAGLVGFGLSTDNLGSKAAASTPASTPAPAQAPAPAPTQTPAPANQPAPAAPVVASPPQTSAPQPATPAVNAGRTPVTLGNGTQVFYDKTGQAFDSSGAPVANANISVSTIGATVTPPTTGGAAPVLPQGTAASSVSDYTSSVGSTLQSQIDQLNATYKQQQDAYQAKIDALNVQNAQLKSGASSALATENAITNSEAQDKAAALQQEQQQYTDNYNAIQGLAAKASALVDQSTQLTQQLQNTTGLQSILNPRISQTAANITAELAVIKGAVDIYSGAIGSAQSQLKSATDAITSIYGDQLTYWNNVINFYDKQQGDNNTQIASLTADQKSYVDAQIKTLSDQVASTRATADYISKAMVDPTTALQFAKAGVTLNDTIPQINAKLATAAYSKELSDTANKMAAAGYSSTPIPGVTPVTTVDSQGNTKNWYANQKPTASAQTTVTEAGGHRLLVDKTTGSVIADLGPATTPTQTSTATEGSDLADAKAFMLANPNVSPNDVMQKFLEAHPGKQAAWNAFFTDSSGKLTYPTPPTPASKGLLGLGFLGL